jgi:hypothetical protein
MAYIFGLLLRLFGKEFLAIRFNFQFPSSPWHCPSCLLWLVI